MVQNLGLKIKPLPCDLLGEGMTEIKMDVESAATLSYIQFGLTPNWMIKINPHAGIGLKVVSALPKPWTAPTGAGVSLLSDTTAVYSQGGTGVGGNFYTTVPLRPASSIIPHTRGQRTPLP